MKLFIAFVISWSVVDGDTISMQAAIWPGIIVEERLRILGIDTPEMRAKQPCERELAAKAKEFTTARLKSAKAITVFVTDRDNFGRVLGSIDVDGSDLGAELIFAKHARSYGTRTPWC